jgi:NADH-quinone oxidoreductase subunit M
MVWALVLVPILAGLLLYALPRSAETTAKWIGVAISFGAFIVAAFGYGAPDETVRWLQRPFVANFHVGLNGPGYWIVLLLTLTTGCALMVARLPRARDFVAQMLVLLGAMTGVFVARDLLVFALFWDLMLIPVFLVLVAWSSTKSSATAWKYLIYNLSGGLALLLATAAFGILVGSTDVMGAGAPLGALSNTASFWIFAGFAIAFAVKTPVWPFHTWAPDTYAELPAPMAAVVSAVQSKAGLYGFLVIGAGLLRGPMQHAATLAVVLGLISLVYGGLAALADDDAKRVVAYSSLSHLGLILIAAFSFDPIAYGGALVYIVAHGLFSAGLFMTIGEVELREDTRLISRLGGLGARNPRLAGGLTIVSLAALGLPGLCGFAGEILILTGLYHAGLIWAAIIALVPVVLAAAYMLRLFQGMMQGPEVDDLPQREDMSALEILALAPLVIAIVLLGVDPAPVTSQMASFTNAFQLQAGAPARGVLHASAPARDVAETKPFVGRTP